MMWFLFGVLIALVLFGVLIALVMVTRRAIRHQRAAEVAAKLTGDCARGPGCGCQQLKDMLEPISPEARAFVTRMFHEEYP